MASIKEIKAQLATQQVDAQTLALLKQDARQGVQQALIQYEKRQQKQQQLVEKAQRMSSFESQARQQGAQVIAGIDEVGRGPLAGPVVAAAVILPEDHGILGLDDSKKLSEAKRLDLYEKICARALAIGIGEVDAATIDRINIYEASKQAMCQAVANLTLAPDHLLIDAMTLPIEIKQDKIIKGDARSVSIAAASIVAKTIRDRQMEAYATAYPGFGFEQNAGYGTPQHLTGLAVHGITPIHRKSFAPVKKYC